MRRTGGLVDGRTAKAGLLACVFLSALPPVRLFAQGDLDRLALRFASMTAVTGLEQARVDSLRARFPGSTGARVGYVTRARGPGAPTRVRIIPPEQRGSVVA